MAKSDPPNNGLNRHPNNRLMRHVNPWQCVSVNSFGQGYPITLIEMMIMVMIDGEVRNGVLDNVRKRGGEQGGEREGGRYRKVTS